MRKIVLVFAIVGLVSCVAYTSEPEKEVTIIAKPQASEQTTQTESAQQEEKPTLEKPAPETEQAESIDQVHTFYYDALDRIDERIGHWLMVLGICISMVGVGLTIIVAIFGIWMPLRKERKREKDFRDVLSQFEGLKKETKNELDNLENETKKMTESAIVKLDKKIKHKTALVTYNLYIHVGFFELQFGHLVFHIIATMYALDNYLDIEKPKQNKIIELHNNIKIRLIEAGKKETDMELKESIRRNLKHVLEKIEKREDKSELLPKFQELAQIVENMPSEKKPAEKADAKKTAMKKDNN